ncbi:GTPase [Williamsia sp.]|uniref:GTPase n=1 Tax=Williamsia sp. TaxID=1872085 RepID=UPI002F925AB8
MAAVATDPMHQVLDQALRSLAGLGGNLVDEANRIGSVLWSPPRVVIVGRLKAGKSTLVNALIGAPVAETAALEATRVVAVYQDGAPSRAEVVDVQGRRYPVTLGREQVTDLPLPAEQIAYLHRWLPSSAIRSITLVDTPGLATLTTENETATRRVLIDGFEQTRTASVDADAAVFLFDSTPRADEVSFLKQLGFTPLNTLGVLSRADGFGEGALGRRDPIEHAATHARVLARQLSDSVATVVPISGLMAQTSRTGALTEADAYAMTTLGRMRPLELIELLESDDPAPLDPRMRDRLLDLVGEYGLINGRAPAGRGAAELNRWLVERSGIAALQHLMHTSLSQFAGLQRASRILGHFDQLAFTHPARDQIRGIAQYARSQPAMRPVALFTDLHRMLDADPASPLVGDLRQLLLGRTPAERLGLPPGLNRGQVQATAAAKLSEAHSQALSTMTSAEDAALVTLIATYTDLAR